MNYALIFAGGVGTRMNSKAMPKQFLEIHGKPIIVHTIEYFNMSKDIDAICVGCVVDWLDYIQSLIDKFNLKKVKWLLPGGETALDTQLIGLRAIKEYDDSIDGNGIVLIHDGVRPLINTKLISDCIEGVKAYGSAITIAPATETIVRTDDNGMITSTIKRSECMLARAPQSFFVKDIVKVHDEAIAEGKHDFIDSTSMMLYYKHKVHIVEGPVENIKVTTPTDFYTCKALLDAKENSQIYGV